MNRLTDIHWLTVIALALLVVYTITRESELLVLINVVVGGMLGIARERALAAKAAKEVTP